MSERLRHGLLLLARGMTGKIGRDIGMEVLLNDRNVFCCLGTLKSGIHSVIGKEIETKKV